MQKKCTSFVFNIINVVHILTPENVLLLVFTTVWRHKFMLKDRSVLDWKWKAPSVGRQCKLMLFRTKNHCFLSIHDMSCMSMRSFHRSHLLYVARCEWWQIFCVCWGAGGIFFWGGVGGGGDLGEEGEGQGNKAFSFVFFVTRLFFCFVFLTFSCVIAFYHSILHLFSFYCARHPGGIRKLTALAKLCIKKAFNKH